jgi:putative glutathione S-transferase
VGLLQEGKWVDRWYQTEDTGGRFVRKSATFRNWITADGSPGSSGSGGFKAEKGRYHLYVSLAVPLGSPNFDLSKFKRFGVFHFCVSRSLVYG